MSRSDFPRRIGKQWTLFLDRDGVLNRRIVDDYVRKWEDWEWLPGVLDSMKTLAEIFGTIVIVTNQRGIARGLYSEGDLAEIHAKMKTDIETAEGKIDSIYFCPHDRDEGCDCRKPKPGPLLQAVEAHPNIDLEKSILVGDSVSDMEAANALNVNAVFIGSVSDEQPSNVLTTLPDLATFARLIQKA